MGAEKYAQELFQQLRTGDFPNLPEKLTFLHNARDERLTDVAGTVIEEILL